jgi:hypothetical protein
LLYTGLEAIMSFDTYLENRTRVPLAPEAAAPYAGQWVAWSADGTTIRASGETMLAVREKLVEKGIDPATVVMAFVPSPDEAIIQ